MLHRSLRLALLACLLWAKAASSTSLYAQDFRLINDGGQTVALSDFSGRTVVLSMDYSRCRFMCSSTFTKLKELRAYADSNRIPLDIVVVSLDPANDTPAEWREYRRMRDLNGSHWHLLTPRPQDMPRIAQLLGIRYWYVGENLVHDFRLVRLNAKGERVAEMNNYDGDPLRFLR